MRKLHSYWFLKALQVAFEKKDWEVHTELEEVDHLGAPLPDGVATLEERKKTLGRSSKRVLILTNSHTGGHKFAGNMIVRIVVGVLMKLIEKYRSTRLRGLEFGKFWGWKWGH